MNHLFKVLLLTVLTTFLYWYVGQLVPQKETTPPKTADFKSDMTPEELAAAGKEIVSGERGNCLLCHTIGSPGARAPDLGGVGARAGKRRKGMSGVDYLAESLFEPKAYVVKGFNPIMPASDRGSSKLSHAEAIAVVAYLQSLGASPTVTLKTALKGGPTASGGGGAKPSGRAAASLAPEEVLEKYGCKACHALDRASASKKGVKKGVGPSLHDVGRRLKPAELYESLLDPDAVVARGFSKGLMDQTLRGNGFYEDLAPAQIKAVVDFLSKKKGK